MPQIFGNVAQQILSTGSVTDGSQKQVRVDRYGDLITLRLGGGFNALAAEGTYFRACNPTMGTGIATAAATTAFSDTAALLVMSNSSVSATGPTIYLDYMRFICTAAGTGATSFNVAVVIDTTQRYSSGGTALTNVNASTGFSTTGIASIHFGAVVAASAFSKRQVSRFILKTQAAPCMVVGDQYFMNFGSNSTALGALNGAAASQFAVDLGPVALAPNGNHSVLIQPWWPSMSAAASFECEIGWWER